jgi:hypothetical protein
MVASQGQPSSGPAAPSDGQTPLGPTNSPAPEFPGPQDFSGAADNSAANASGGQSSTPSDSSSSQPGAPDPISEAPDMIWYVRPTAGGQFGPASGEVMRTWLTEGRVAADSLVWREGWRDWQTAGDVFPKLLANQIMNLFETAAAPSVSTPSTTVHRTKPHSSSDNAQFVMIGVLCLAAAVLFAVFLYVLFVQ